MPSGTDARVRRRPRDATRYAPAARPLREQIKSVAEALLAHGGPVDVALALTRSPGAVLAYHNVIADGRPRWGDRSLHMPLSDFRRQLDHLERVYDVVPLDELTTPRRGDGRKPRVAITFDDAYRGAVTLAVPEIASRGLPATIFVSPGLVGDRPFWWDVYSGDKWRLPRWRERALDELGGDHQRIREWTRRAGFNGSVPPPIARSATLEELREASALDGIGFGSHSWNHHNLTRVDPRELAGDLGGSLRWLRLRFERVMPWLAYPYGLWNESVKQVAESVGYRGAVTIGTGLLPRHRPDPYLVPRVSVPAGVSIEGFMLRTAGLLSR